MDSVLEIIYFMISVNVKSINSEFYKRICVLYEGSLKFNKALDILLICVAHFNVEEQMQG